MAIFATGRCRVGFLLAWSLPMSNSVRLSLEGPVALQGTQQGIWIADQASQSVTCFRAEDARRIRALPLPGIPVALAAAHGFLAVGLSSGTLIAFDADSGRELWQNTTFHRNILMRGSGQFVWAADQDGGALFAFDRAGPVTRVTAKGLQAFAPANDQIFWLSKDGLLTGSELSGKRLRTEPLRQPFEGGGMVCCANALWFSITKHLLMIDLVSLRTRTILATREGPVPHVICEDGKLAGGSSTIFVLNPRIDMGFHMIVPLLRPWSRLLDAPVIHCRSRPAIQASVPLLDQRGNAVGEAFFGTVAQVGCRCGRDYV
jgi:hypothetical protein